MTRSERILVASVAVLVAVVSGAVALPGREPDLRFFDIGQGDAILVQQGTVQMLVDGGPDAAVLSKLGEAMPFFDRTIEFVVATHPDKDHFGGLADVLSRYRVGTVILDGVSDDGPAYRRFADALEKNGARVAVARAGDVVRLTDRVKADIVWPAEGFAADDQNDLSLVMRLMVDGSPAALLTGDATDEVEPLMSPEDINAPILKVGHHGSAHSTSARFLDAVRPAAAVISVGARNPYGHPAGSVLYRLSSRGIAILRTDEAGDVRASFEGGVAVLCTGAAVPVFARCGTAR